MKLFISKTKNLDAKEATILTVLNGLQNNKQDYLTVSVNGIAYNLTKRFLNKSVKKDRTIIDNIKVGIQSLADKKIIAIIEQYGDDFIISNDGLEVHTEKDKFVVVELWELQKIFSESNKPFNVFDFFINLVGTINNITKEWHMSQDEMASTWGYGKETVNNYMEQLEQMKLIYVHRQKKRRVDGTYHKLNNSYGRYADKDFIIKASHNYVNTVECEDVYENIDRRSIKLRYNAFCNGAKKYKDNPAAVIALYKECVLYNKSLKNKPIEGVYDGEWKQGEPLDLSVFPDYAMNGVFKNDTKDQWGEDDPLEQDCSAEDIFDIPNASAKDKVEKLTDVSEEKVESNNAITNPTKIITIKKSVQKENVSVPDDVIIQRYADNLYKEHGNEYKKSLFIAEFAKKFPELDDYERYWYRAKSFFELNVL